MSGDVVAEKTVPTNDRFSLLNANDQSRCFLHAVDKRTDANGQDGPQSRASRHICRADGNALPYLCGLPLVMLQQAA